MVKIQASLVVKQDIHQAISIEGDGGELACVIVLVCSYSKHFLTYPLPQVDRLVSLSFRHFSALRLLEAISHWRITIAQDFSLALHVGNNRVCEFACLQFGCTGHQALQVICDLLLHDRGSESLLDQFLSFRPTEIFQHHRARQDN